MVLRHELNFGSRYKNGLNLSDFGENHWKFNYNFYLNQKQLDFMVDSKRFWNWLI